MKVVRFLRTTEDGQVESGRTLFDGCDITFEGLSDHFEEILEQGIVGKHGKEYKPSDGIEFMKNLKYEFPGSYLRATGVHNE